MMNMRSIAMTTLLPIVLACVACVATNADEQVPTTKQLEFFEKKVRPLFSKYCYECHSVNAKRLEANLLLDSRAAQLLGGDTGAAIVPGDAC